MSATEPVPASKVKPRRLPKLRLGHQRVKMAHLRPAERNPRRGAVADVVESVREFGQHREVVVRQANNEVVVGNHLYKAIEALGWDEIDCYVVADDQETAMRRAIADNAVGDKAEWDERELAAVLEEVGAVPGYGDKDIDRLLARLDDDQPPPAVTFPIVIRPNEEYDYVLVVAANATDAAFLQTKFDLRREQSYKEGNKPVVGRCHVVGIERLKELWGR